jgi:hypothetical protein
MEHAMTQTMAARPHDASSATWFSRILWTGIAANIAFSLPALVAPIWSLELMRMPVASPLVWTRFSGQLVILLSLFYIPAAIDPYRYRANAWLAVASRLAGVLFFGCVTLFSAEREYWLFGVFDLAFMIPLAVFLTKLSREGAPDRNHGPDGQSRKAVK